MSNTVLQANLLYLYFSIPLSPLSHILCVFAGKPLSCALLNAGRSASYKARASVLSRGSLGYRGISGPATPDVHTKIRTFVCVTISHNPKTNDGIIKSITSTRVVSLHKLL